MSDEYTFPIVGPVVMQSIMLLAQYGFELGMPWWVVWFPFLFYGAILGIILTVVVFLLLLWLVDVIFTVILEHFRDKKKRKFDKGRSSLFGRL